MNENDKQKLRENLKKLISLKLDELNSIYLSNGFKRDDFLNDLNEARK